MVDESNKPKSERPTDSQAGPAEAALRATEAAAEKVREEVDRSDAFELPAFQDDDIDGQAEPGTLKFLDDVKLRVSVELGRTRMYVEDVLRLSANSIVELDKAAGDPVDIYVNDRHVARGEVLVLDENFCVRVSEILHDGESNEETG